VTRVQRNIGEHGKLHVAPNNLLSVSVVLVIVTIKSYQKVQISSIDIVHVVASQTGERIARTVDLVRHDTFSLLTKGRKYRRRRIGGKWITMDEVDSISSF
jgi:hypothetical protein